MFSRSPLVLTRCIAIPADEMEKAYVKTFRDRIAFIYGKAAPDKVSGLDVLLGKYQGKEAQLLRAIETKYGIQVC